MYSYARLFYAVMLRTRLESEESELKFKYAQFLLQLTYVCN